MFDFIKQKMEERRSKKSLEQLKKDLDDIRLNKKRRVAQTGEIYDANDEDAIMNRLDDVFDKHHGW